MRMLAPHWQALTARWAEAACLFYRLASPAIRLSQLAAIKREKAQSLPEPVIQLLASSAATVLKAARITGINADFYLPGFFLHSVTGVTHTTISLLLPRMAGAGKPQQGVSSPLLCAVRAVDSALGLSRCRLPELCPLMVLGSCHVATLVDGAAGELLHCSEPTTTRRDAHSAVGSMSYYATHLSTLIHFLASQGCEGAPTGTAPLRDLLARPLLTLLHSPLLDTLVALQHVMTRALPSLQRAWEANEGASICQMHQTPAPAEPDAMESKVAMQVGHPYYSL